MGTLHVATHTVTSEVACYTVTEHHAQEECQKECFRGLCVHNNTSLCKRVQAFEDVQTSMYVRNNRPKILCS